MTMSNQPDALALAGLLDSSATCSDMGRPPDPSCLKRKASALLRSQHARIEQLAAEVESLKLTADDHWMARALRAEAEAEALRADAERYRWLRSHDNERCWHDVQCFVEVPQGPCDPKLEFVEGDELDAAIDAGMKHLSAAARKD